MEREDVAKARISESERGREKGERSGGRLLGVVVV